MRHTFFKVKIKLIVAVMLALIAFKSSAMLVPYHDGTLFDTSTGERFMHSTQGFHDPRFGDPLDPEIREIRAPLEDSLRRAEYGTMIDREADYFRRSSPMIGATWDDPRVFEDRLPYAMEPMYERPFDPRRAFEEEQLFLARAKAARRFEKDSAKEARRVLKVNDEQLREAQRRYEFDLMRAELEALKKERFAATTTSKATLDVVATRLDIEEDEKRAALAAEARKSLEEAARYQAENAELEKLLKEYKKSMELLEEKYKDKKQALRTLEEATGELLEEYEGYPKKTQPTDSPDDAEAVADSAESDDSKKPPLLLTDAIAPSDQKKGVFVVADPTPDVTDREETAIKIQQAFRKSRREDSIQQNNAATKIQRAVRRRAMAQKYPDYNNPDTLSEQKKRRGTAQQIGQVMRASAVLQQVKDLYDNPEISDENLSAELAKIFQRPTDNEQRARANIGLTYAYVRIFEKLQTDADDELATLNDKTDPDGIKRQELTRAKERFSVAQRVLEGRRQQEIADVTRREARVKIEVYNLTAADAQDPIVIVDRTTGRLKASKTSQAQAVKYKLRAVQAEKARFTTGRKLTTKKGATQSPDPILGPKFKGWASLEASAKEETPFALEDRRRSTDGSDGEEKDSEDGSTTSSSRTIPSKSPRSQTDLDDIILKFPESITGRRKRPISSARSVPLPKRTRLSLSQRTHKPL